MLQVKGGSFGYTPEKAILNNITFTLKEREILAVMGPNGVGKTTLLKCLMGILKWQSGHSKLDGKDSSEARIKIGYVPQAHQFSFPYSVLDMVVFGRAKYMSVFATPGKEDYRIAKEALEEVGILHLSDKSCNRLSGGQLQMVLIARALAGEPRLLILDEPESHLDFYNQLTILEIIKRLTKEKKIACVMNTHYPNHAIKVADQVLLLNDCKSVFGKPIEVLTQENVRAYFGVDSAIVRTRILGKEISTFVILNQSLSENEPGGARIEHKIVC
ncbi:ABC transporter ATP-binding protein [Fusibacter paucivorans]|uniref:ABC transporter ATP-binding protein n=1 Tax=Fusibacter paucivorans TaxID=76009 RepID=A0ABS5PU82_9FIRM|nr:ABC transporter ATP-binding protein [Fusibacter paucivorans]MBS7527959.1 ABC transporter ATP-binding protein [Fusibacter paucivorans]